MFEDTQGIDNPKVTGARIPVRTKGRLCDGLSLQQLDTDKLFYNDTEVLKQISKWKYIAYTDLEN